MQRKISKISKFLKLAKRENYRAKNINVKRKNKIFRIELSKAYLDAMAGREVRSRSLPADYFFSLLRSFIARAMGPRAAAVGSGKDSWDSVSVRFRMGISPRTMKISSHAGRGAAVRSNGLHT